jgi:hypothetical protein
MEKTFKPGDQVQFLNHRGELCTNEIYHNSYTGNIYDVKHGDEDFKNKINIGTVIRVEVEKNLIITEFDDIRGNKVRLGFYPQYLRLKNQAYLKTITIIDWENVPSGTFFTWGSAVGRINIVGENFYFCSDERSGADENMKWGYKYSWKVAKSNLNIKFSGINITLSDTCPEGHIVPEEAEVDFHIKIAGYTPVICKGNVKFGCQTIPNSLIRELVAELRD